MQWRVGELLASNETAQVSWIVRTAPLALACWNHSGSPAWHSLAHSWNIQVKSAMRKRARIPYCIERSVFVLGAAVMVTAMLLLWQPLPRTVWKGA